MAAVADGHHGAEGAEGLADEDGEGGVGGVGEQEDSEERRHSEQTLLQPKAPCKMASHPEAWMLGARLELQRCSRQAAGSALGISSGRMGLLAASCELVTR